MNRFKRLVFSGMIVMATASTANASLINHGFETGDLTGWSVSYGDLASVVTDTCAYDGSLYTAAEGNYFLLLSAGAGASVYTTASQLFLGQGQTVSGSAAFLAFDYTPYTDDAFVKIYDQNKKLLATPWAVGIPDVGNFNATPWMDWSWTAPTAGQYILEYGVNNGGDNALWSIALFDAPASVPEPSTFILLGIGLAGASFLRRKRA